MEDRSMRLLLLLCLIPINWLCGRWLWAYVCRSAGGQLKIESTPGKGSTFSMVFPKSRIFDDESV